MNRPGRSRGAWCATVLPALLLAVCTGCTRDEKTAKNVDTSPPAEAVHAPAEAVHALDEARESACRGEHERLLAFYRSLPATFSDMSEEEREALVTQILAMQDNARGFLAGCAVETAAGKELAPDAHFFLGKFLFLMKRIKEREVSQALSAENLSGAPLMQEFQKRMTQFYGETIGELAAAAAGLARESALRPDALLLLGQASFEGGRYAESKKAYETFIADYGVVAKHRDSAAEALAALGKTLLELGEHRRGVELAERGWKEFGDTPTGPYFSEVLWKLYQAEGNLEAMESTVDRVLEEIPKRLSAPGLAEKDRHTLENLLFYNGFRKGFIQHARGDLAAAAESFRRHIGQLDALELERKALPQAWDIYRRRSQAHLAFLDELAGSPPPRDLDLDSGWITGEKLVLASEVGKVVALLFRRVGDDRSAGFLAPLSHICASEPDLRIATISFLHSGENVPEALGKLRTELAEIAYLGPAGFDPDNVERSLFRAYHAMIGSATLVIVDRAGKLAWFQQDPWEVHVNFVKAIMQRLAAS